MYVGNSQYYVTNLISWIFRILERALLWEIRCVCSRCGEIHFVYLSTYMSSYPSIYYTYTYIHTHMITHVCVSICPQTIQCLLAVFMMWLRQYGIKKTDQYMPLKKRQMSITSQHKQFLEMLFLLKPNSKFHVPTLLSHGSTNFKKTLNKTSRWNHPWFERFTQHIFLERLGGGILKCSFCWFDPR